jgi:type I restriction enzyme M protein
MVSFIWSVADLLRGPYHPNQYKDVMLPMTVLRRLDCVLEPTKEQVLAEHKKLIEAGKQTVVDFKLQSIAGMPFYNTSRFTFEKLKGDPDNIAANLIDFIKGFSSKARDIIDHFRFEDQIAKLDKDNRLYLVVSKFCTIDFHPSNYDNRAMGYIFEELIRRFNELSNEEAGDHFTPREVIRLMVSLLFSFDNDALTNESAIRSLYDPACGTGGMLSVAEDYIKELNSSAHLEVFGQDYNEQAYAICGSDMLIKGKSIENIAYGDSFTKDSFKDRKFDYMLANPPFGVEWKPEEEHITREHEEMGFAGRFGPGLPRINDGSLLFLLHMISKMKPEKENGTRLCIVFNGSPLFTGSAGSGESDIRRWIIENDMLETIVALPDQLFYNTGIYTYLWLVTNRKRANRKGKIQLIDATSCFKKMRKSLGNKRNEICEAQRDEIVRLYGDFAQGDKVRIFDNADFGYNRVTVERPLKLNFATDDERIETLKENSAFAGLAQSKKKKNAELAQQDVEEGIKLQQQLLSVLETLKTLGVVKNRDKFSQMLKDAFKKAGLVLPAPLFKAVISALSKRDDTADICQDAKGNPEPDPELRDFENIPLKEDIASYIKREVTPHVPDAWVDESKTKVGYEINFNRYFYKYTPPRPLEDIEAELAQIEEEIAQMLEEARQ